jgi:hypothetical protein
MPRVVHFEVGAENIERASTFYREAFGWRTQSWDGPSEYTFLVTGEDGEPGIDGAVIAEQGSFPRVLLTLDVPSVEDAEQRVVSAGGKIIRPNHPIEGVGRLAYVEDTEGNVFGLMERAPAA